MTHSAPEERLSINARGGGGGGSGWFSARQISTASTDTSTWCTDNQTTGRESLEAYGASPCGSSHVTRYAPSVVPMLPLHLVHQTQGREDSSPALPERMSCGSGSFPSHAPPERMSCSSASFPSHNVTVRTCEALQPLTQSVAGSVRCVTPMQARELRQAGTLSGKCVVWSSPHDSM